MVEDVQKRDLGPRVPQCHEQSVEQLHDFDVGIDSER